MEDSLKDLAFFFRSCPIIVPTKMPRGKQRQRLLDQSNGDYGYAADFDNKEGDERVIRKGLWYVSRKRYANIGINDYAINPIERPLATMVPSSEYPWPFIHYPCKKGFMFPVRVPLVSPIYLNPLEELSVCRGKLLAYRVMKEVWDSPRWVADKLFQERTYDMSLTQVMHQWISDKKMPQTVQDLFTASCEDQQKLYRMIGSRAYRISEHKNVSEEIKKIADATRADTREQRAITLSDLEKVVLMSSLQEEAGKEPWVLIEPPKPFNLVEWFRHHDEHPYSVEAVRQAAHFVAQAAHDIRQGYKQKGWEVRDGLVHRQAYKKLERIASETAPSEIVHQIVDAIKNDEWNNPHPKYSDPVYDTERSLCETFRQAFYHLIIREKTARTPIEVYEKIGELRTQQWLEGVMPYSSELRLMCKIMHHHLAVRRFRKHVNQWLEKHIQRTIDWRVIDQAIPRGSKNNLSNGQSSPPSQEALA